MAENSQIPTPWRLGLRRVQHQVLPIVTVLLCASLAGWIWARQTRSAVMTGEVSSVVVKVESKQEGMLEDLPRAVKLFDTVRSGQVIARINTSAAEAELARLEQESGQLNGSALMLNQKRMDELKLKIAQKEIKSPVAGTIVEIKKRPGETATMGKALMTVAGERGDFIIGYLRQDQTIRPTPGMAVDIRGRGAATARFRSYVQSVGPQVQALPARHLRNPAVVEYGLMVQVVMPPEAEFKPGEMVDLVLRGEGK